MNEQELVADIKKLVFEKGISRDKLIASSHDGEIDLYLEEEENKDLKLAYLSSNFFKEGSNWHHVVHLALDTDDERRYMREQILKLMRKHARNSTDKYFKLKIANEDFSIPPVADFNTLELLYQKFFEIYQNIKNQINFDNIPTRQIGPIRGKINWAETIQRSTTKFPIEFVTNISPKQFVTPENILLIICAECLYRESSRLLRVSFKEELSSYDRSILHKIYENSQSILENFPFKDVLQASRSFWNLGFQHIKIKELENETKKRIRDQKIRNQNYTKLLQWIDDFRELNTQKIAGLTSTKNVLTSIKHVDTMYEVWIFLEFIDYLYEKNILIDCNFGSHAKCRFSFEGTEITFWYEKEFQVGKGKTNSWAKIHYPDYIAMIDDERLAVFDAKNYSKSSKITDVQDKMLSYMNNLNVNFGALIFPYHPVLWDELDEEKKGSQLTHELICDSEYYKDEINSIEEDKRKSRIKGIRKKQKTLSWADDEFHFKEKFPIGYSKEEYPKDETTPIHEKKVLALCRMLPEDNLKSREMKKATLDFIFKSIVTRAPLTV